MSTLALYKGNRSAVQGEGANAPKRSALLKSKPAAPAQDDILEEFRPADFGATKVSSDAGTGRILRAKAYQPLQEESEFRPQPSPQAMNPSGKVLGYRRAEQPEHKLPPISSRSVSVPTGDPPPPGTPPPPPPVTVDKIIIEQAEAKAKEMIEQATGQINLMLQQANEQIQQFQQQAAVEAENMRQAAFQKGLEEGREEGRRLAHVEYVDLMLQARDLYVQTVKERTKLIEATEPELANLSVSIAEKIIGLEVTTSGEVILGVVKNALSDMKDREEVKIHVNPDDYHIVNNERSALMRMVEGLKDFDLTVDNKVTRGGCIIETNLGNIDARLETQLSAIKIAFGRSSKGEEDDGSDAG